MGDEVLNPFELLVSCRLSEFAARSSSPTVATVLMGSRLLSFQSDAGLAISGLLIAIQKVYEEDSLKRGDQS